MNKIDLIINNLSRQLLEADIDPYDNFKVLLHKDISNNQEIISDIYSKEKRFGRSFVKLGGLRDYDLPLRTLAAIDFKVPANSWIRTVKIPTFRKGQMPKDIKKILIDLFLVEVEIAILSSYLSLLKSGKIKLRNNMKVLEVISMIKKQIPRAKKHITIELKDIIRYINSIIQDKMEELKRANDIQKAKILTKLGSYTKPFDELSAKKAVSILKENVRKNVNLFLKTKGNYLSANTTSKRIKKGFENLRAKIGKPEDDIRDFKEKENTKKRSKLTALAAEEGMKKILADLEAKLKKEGKVDEYKKLLKDIGIKEK